MCFNPTKEETKIAQDKSCWTKYKKINNQRMDDDEEALLTKSKNKTKDTQKRVEGKE